MGDAPILWTGFLGAWPLVVGPAGPRPVGVVDDRSDLRLLLPDPDVLQVAVDVLVDNRPTVPCECDLVLTGSKFLTSSD
jgi:hypothetical protein